MKTKKMAFGGNTSAVPLQQRLTTGQGPMQPLPQTQPPMQQGPAQANANAAFNRPGGMPGRGSPQGGPFQGRPGGMQGGRENRDPRGYRPDGGINDVRSPQPMPQPGPQQLATTGTAPTMPAQQTSGQIYAQQLAQPTQQQLADYNAINSSKSSLIGAPPPGAMYKKGGKVKAKEKAYAKGGSVKSASSASRRGDGIAQRGKTRGRMV